jgi:hypothetical protein
MKGGSEHRPAVAVAVAVAVVVAVVEGGEPHMVVEEPGNIPGLPGDHERHYELQQWAYQRYLLAHKLWKSNKYFMQPIHKHTGKQRHNHGCRSVRDQS